MTATQQTLEQSKKILDAAYKEFLAGDTEKTKNHLLLDPYPILAELMRPIENGNENGNIIYDLESYSEDFKLLVSRTMIDAISKQLESQKSNELRKKAIIF
jgi:hypothetical protein